MTMIVDVRTEGEFATGHIEGAVNIPVDYILSGRLEELASVPKDTPIYLYCRSGARAQYAQMFLAAKGYSKVENWGGLAAAQEQAAKVK